MTPRWRKVVRDLSSHWFRTMLVVLSIAIGIFAVGVMLGGREILLREFARDYKDSVPANITYHAQDFGDEVVRRAESEPGVKAAQGRRSVDMRFTWRGSDDQRTLTVQAFEDFGHIAVDKAEPLNDVPWPPATGEVVLENSARMVADYKVGDVLSVERADGEVVELRVAGFAHSINAMPAHLVGNETGYVTFATMEELGEPAEYNQLAIALSGDDLTRAEAAKRAADLRTTLFEDEGLFVGYTDVPKPGSHFIGDIFSALSLLLLALGVLSLGLSGFLVVNTVTALMAQQVRQVGIMKAIGAQAAQLEGLYAGMVSAYGILAVAVGLPGTAAGTRWFTDFAGRMLNFRVLDYAPPLWVLAVEVAVGMLVPLLAAATPVRRGVRMSVVRALNATGVTAERFGRRLTDRILGAIRGLPRPVALSLRNTFLRKGRLALTLVTLALASGMVIAIFSMQTSVDRTVADLERWWNYDAQLSFAEPQDASAVEAVAEEAPGVKAAAAWPSYRATVVRADGTENMGFGITGVDAASDFVRPTMIEGRWLEAGDTDAVVINSDAQKEEPSLEVGGDVTVNVLGNERALKIVGIVKGQLGGAALYCPRDTLDDIAGTAKVTRLLVRGDTALTEEQQQSLLDDVESRLTDAGYAVSEAQTRGALASHIRDLLGILLAFLYVLAALLAAVGVIGLTGTMMTNVLESTREIGVMRATGAQHRSIYQIFMTEGMTIGFLAWAVGALLAFPLSIGLVRALNTAMGIPLSYAFSWLGVGAWLGLMLVISAGASIAPAFRASQVSVRDAIAYE
jgi:putative ABC transport system permease protein